jgi:hypothetical protein
MKNGNYFDHLYSSSIIQVMESKNTDSFVLDNFLANNIKTKRSLILFIHVA